MTRVTLIDYGAGNLRSLRAAFERLGAAVETTSDAVRVRRARMLVLPGVGAAGPAMAALTEGGLAEAIGASTAPLLGVCLGMQLLFERSLEGDVACLGLLAGSVEPITWAPQVPHMGWNDVEPAADHPLASALPAVCYFAHSYAVSPGGERRVVVAETEVGGRAVPSVVADGRVAGVQFHPEKSGPAGRALLQEWLRAA
ncbi:MAG: imidazole glycerol-phosphate synthase subunit HisH [Gaiellales bacterium]|nr:imidazole glycerol-phosphate synthase subunit HisH [Gaiellales bacterium]